MKRRALGLAAALLISANAAASEEQSDPLVSVVQHYVERVVAQQETSGKIVVDVVPALTNAGLCQMPCPFMPAGQRMRGNITVGVKCINEQGHDMPRYYRARIGIEDDYIVAARDLMPGTLLSAADIDTQHGDITRLTTSNAPLARAADVVGQRLTRRVVAGAPLQTTMVKAPLVITRNSRVTVIARQAGFTITAQGTAMDEAPSEGQLRVRMDSKKIIMARATAPGEAVAIH
ncbi:flagellar basal body P-ring formation chaperone FlgA [Zymobacter palmae]|uniref:Flagella basal body P-ring formation protein FlgA n=1 Tax=Zymobacter palmae TaxID=33074 RepID=A0A348HFH9_9GAMM|nr:flagellar basal body P-ring formation chaperone FlgA [Zymobacter palmae]BBG30381.1 flagellar basal body P-ring formation protein FlgA [Zymobacter palmae]